MKLMERVREQANTRKKVEGYGLKFIHSNWNSNSNSNIYYDFEVIFRVPIEVIFLHALYRFKAWESKNSNLQMVCKSELKRGRYGWLKRTMQRGIKGMSTSHEQEKWTREIVFTTTWELISHEHANFCTTMPNVPKWC